MSKTLMNRSSRAATWSSASVMASCAFAAAAALTATIALLPQPAHAVDPLVVAQPGFPAGFVLEKLNARAAFLAGKAMGEGSLIGTKNARELQLMIANTKVALGDGVEERWDKLGADAQAILRSLDKTAAVTPPDNAPHGRIEDRIVLDVSSQLTRPPFSNDGTPAVKRIEGASITLRADGSYRINIETNLPAAGAKAYSVAIAGQAVPADWLQVAPPNRVALTIPVAALEKNFGDRTLVHLPAELSAVMPSTSWKFWQSNVKQVSFPFSLELFPRKPFSYVLKELSAPSAVDEKRTLMVKGAPQTVPGCGKAGCVHDQVVCVDAPAGSKPVDTINFRDSMSSSDPNGGWTGAVSPTPTGFCAIYKQQSPTVARQVSFDVRYNPLAGDRQETEKKLQAPRKKPSDPPPDADALEFGTLYGADLSPQFTGYELTLKAFTGQTYSAAAGAGGNTPPSSPLMKLQPPEREVVPPRLRVSFQAPW